MGLLISTAAWSQSGTSDQTGTSSTGTSAGSQTTTGGDTSTTTTTTTQTTTDVDRSSDRPRLEVTGFAGYTFNQGVNFDSAEGLSPQDVSFYNSIRQRDRFSYGAGISYDVTPNLEVGALWSRMSGPLELRDFNRSSALAAGWVPAGSGSSGGVGTGGTGTGGTSTGGTGATASFPLLTTTNGASPYRIGDLDVNTFHGIVGWNFGPQDAMVRPFVFGGAGVTRYGEFEYQFANANATGGSSMITARLDPDTRFSTTWGVGVKIAPTRGLGIRVAGRWTPTRLAGGNFVSSTTASGTGTSGTSATATSGATGTDQGWWCSGQLGCFANDSRFLNQFSLTGGLILRF